MKEKIAGYLILDGIIEGKFPNNDEGVDLLYDWLNSAKKNKLIFHLETVGHSYNILADNKPVNVNELTTEPDILIENALKQLLSIYPENDKSKVFSTLRSTEYKKNLEIQSMYLINANGEVTIETREVDIATIDQEKPLSLKDRMQLVAIGILIVIAVLFISSFFIDYQAIYAKIVNTFSPLQIDEIKIQTGDFTKYFTVIKKEKYKHKHIHIMLKRTAVFPTTDKNLQELYQAANTIQEKLVLASIAKGYILYEAFDKKNQYIESASIRIKDLKNKDTISLFLPYNNDHKPQTILFSPY